MFKIILVPDGTQVIQNIQQNLKHYFSNHEIKSKWSKLKTLDRKIILSCIGCITRQMKMLEKEMKVVTQESVEEKILKLIT
jgi:imidazoleglycerol phosphate synthase glutamine amidotransferase subunit HisH